MNKERKPKKVSLRLNDEQHHQLKCAVAMRRTSIQEIMMKLLVKEGLIAEG